MADRVKPSDNEPNEYAGFVAPQRADQSTVSGQAGSYYGDSEPGNTVDPERINKTVKGYSSDKSTVKPAGPPSAFGY